MKNDEKESSLFTDAKTVLQESTRHLDETTLARLRAARVRAVAVSPRTARRHWLWAGVTTAIAAGVVLTFSLWVDGVSQHPAGVPGVTNIDDIDLLSGSEEMRFYQDLEFYRWLDSENGAG